jgi:two-component system nitrate/nitrite response regulator NarL
MTTRTRIRVVMAEDHPIYLEGLSRAIKDQPELELVGTATNGRDALATIRELQPDVAVLDVRLPDLSGTEVLSAIMRDHVPTRVVMLSAETDSEAVFEAVQTGAGAYLSKDASRREITEAIVAVSRGGTVLAPQVHAALVGELRIRRNDDRPALTPREREVLVHISHGLSAPEIGRTLHVSPATVKTHLQSLYEKLGVSERAAAVAEAMRRGLLE